MTLGSTPAGTLPGKLAITMVANDGLELLFTGFALVGMALLLLSSAGGTRVHVRIHLPVRLPHIRVPFVRITRADGQATVDVVDDGRGGTPEPGSGLRGLAERTRERGGTMSAAPLPHEGFRLRVCLPLPAPAPTPTLPERGRDSSVSLPQGTSEKTA